MIEWILWVVSTDSLAREFTFSQKHFCKYSTTDFYMEQYFIFHMASSFQALNCISVDIKAKCNSHWSVIFAQHGFQDGFFKTLQFGIIYFKKHTYAVWLFCTNSCPLPIPLEPFMMVIYMLLEIGQPSRTEFNVKWRAIVGKKNSCEWKSYLYLSSGMKKRKRISFKRSEKCDWAANKQNCIDVFLT